MDIHKIHELLPIEVLIYKIQMNGNHITFKQDGEVWFTDEIKQKFIDNNLTYEFIPFKMGDDDFILRR